MLVFRFFLLLLADGNTITAGNSQQVTLSNIFITPDVSTVTISSTLNAEMDFSADIQSFTFELGLIDCNGDLNGGAYIDNCDNCVGGNTESDPCVSLDPQIEIIFLNNECNSLTSLKLALLKLPISLILQTHY